MKITHIGHACILVEAGGLTLLSDPWWRGPCFGAQWWTYPVPYVHALEGKQIDYIYISHGHHDHFHPGTLRGLPKTAKVLISNQLDLAPAIHDLGFETIEIAPDEPAYLGASRLEVRIMPTHGDDTLMTINDAGEVCVNLNDALHSAPYAVQNHFIKHLRMLYPTINYVFCGYGVASHFPNCYRLPGKDDVATASLRQAYFNQQWASIMARLAPKFGFPFAADVVILQDELFWVNEVTHNLERPTGAFRQRFPESSTQAIDIGPGFQIEKDRVLSMVTRPPLDSFRIREELGPEVIRANRVHRDNHTAVVEVFDLLQARVTERHAYLASFVGDYRVALQFINSPTVIVLEKAGTAVTLRIVDAAQVQDADVTYTTRWSYLRWALQRPHGDELLFLGSGGIFEYATLESAERAIHRELIALLRTKPPPTRRAEGSLARRAKQFAKRMLGRDDRDLYDLLDWTAFSTGSSPAIAVWAGSARRSNQTDHYGGE
jgi:hypothetical protein